MRKLYFDLDPRPINRPVQYLRLEFDLRPDACLGDMDREAFRADPGAVPVAVECPGAPLVDGVVRQGDRDRRRRP